MEHGFIDLKRQECSAHAGFASFMFEKGLYIFQPGRGQRAEHAREFGNACGNFPKCYNFFRDLKLPVAMCGGVCLWVGGLVWGCGEGDWREEGREKGVCGVMLWVVGCGLWSLRSLWWLWCGHDVTAMSLSILLH